MSKRLNKKKVTIYDVAREAGVAISTVSRVLNESPEVSEATRQKVLAAVERLKFRPDRMAKFLARRDIPSVAVAVPSFTSLFYIEMLKGVKDYLQKQNKELLLCNMGSRTPRQNLHQFLQRGAVHALLLFSLPVDDELAEELRTLQAPVVLIGTQHPDFDSLYWDETAGARAAVRHLVDMGHRHIGTIVAHAWSFNTESRIRGYREALEEAGIPFEPRLVKTGDTLKHAGFSEEAGFEAMQKLLKEEPELTAVFANSDVQAIGAMKAIRQAGKRIPEDIAIVGYDDIKISRFIDLSSVNLALYKVGYRATERLLERLANPELKPVQQKITPRLMVRASSRFDRNPPENNRHG